jgi:hypothetical protein
MGCGLVGQVGGPGWAARGLSIGCGFSGHVGGPAWADVAGAASAAAVKAVASARVNVE